MKLIHSKDIYFITRDVLKLMDPKVMNHGCRTAYILYKMLQIQNKYEMYEIAEFALLATLHDIGAYGTDFMQDVLRYETQDATPHSIYGYLYLTYLTPFKDRAKIILYHHTNHSQIQKSNYEFLDVAAMLNVAEKMDLYANALGSRFDYLMFQKHADIKYSAKALDLFYQAQHKYDVLKHLSDESYKEDLDELFEYLIFTNEEKRDCILGLIYILGFRSEYTMVDMATCTHVCEQLGEKMLLSIPERESLYYAAVLHDAGMAGVPKEILEAPRRLTDEEMKELRTHVLSLNRILKGRITQECLEIINAHHERCDGSGYPLKLKDHQMNLLQKILQVADTITGLTAKRSYREPKTKDQVIDILKRESDSGRLNKETVWTFINNYDEIMEGVSEANEKMLSVYKKLKESYATTEKQMNNR